MEPALVVCRKTAFHSLHPWKRGLCVFSIFFGVWKDLEGLGGADLGCYIFG